MRVSATRNLGCLFGLVVVVLLAGIGEVREAEGQSQKCKDDWINKDPNKTVARQTQFNKCVAQRNLDRPTNVPNCGTPPKCRTYTWNSGTKMCILGWKAGDCTTHCNSNGIPDACRTDYEPGDFILKMTSPSSNAVPSPTPTPGQYVYDGSGSIRSDRRQELFMQEQLEAYKRLEGAITGSLGRTVYGSGSADSSFDPNAVIIQRFDSDPLLFSLRNISSDEMTRVRGALGRFLASVAKKARQVTFSPSVGIAVTPGATPSPIPGRSSKPSVNAKQWGLANSGGAIVQDYDGRVYRGQKSVDIDAVNAWALERGTPEEPGTGASVGRRSVVVAVVDDGFNLTTSEFRSNLYVNTGEVECNNVDDDGNGFVDDYSGWDAVLKHGCYRDGALSETNSSLTVSKKGHGTHVASIIASVPTQGDSYSATGVAPFVSILPIKASYSEDGAFYSDALTEAYQYILALKRQGVPIVVLNTSYTGSCNMVQGLERSSIQALVDADITVVGAAGNGGLDSTQDPQCPGGLGATAQDPGGVKGVLSIAMSAPGPECPNQACSGATKLLAWSNFGSTVNTAAPGTAIYANGEYRSGTSMAAPMVTGIVALMYSVNPFIKPAQIEAILSSPANARLNPATGKSFGFPVQSGGLISAKSAIEQAARDVIAGKVENPTGAGVGNVVVVLSDSAGRQRMSRTDSLGFFFFPRPQIGTQIEVGAVGGIEPPIRVTVRDQRLRFKFRVAGKGPE